MLSNKERGFRVDTNVLGGMELHDEEGGFEPDVKTLGRMKAASKNKRLITCQSWQSCLVNILTPADCDLICHF